MSEKKKPSLSRRSFVRRAGMFVSALGVGGAVQTGLMDSILRKATKKWGGEAFAADNGVVHYVVEICLRAGFQFNSLFPSTGHSMPIGQRASDLNFYSSPANVLRFDHPGDSLARPVYFTRYGAGVGGDRLFNTISSINASGKHVGVATSETIVLQNGNHRPDFRTRSPNTNAPSPAVLHAFGPGVPKAPVQAVVFNTVVDVANVTGPLPSIDGNGVTGKDQLFSLYRDLPMYFTFDELKLIVGELENGAVKPGGVGAGAIHSLDEIFKMRNVPGTDAVASVSLNGRQQSQLQIGQLLDTTYAAVTGNFIGIDDGTPVFSGGFPNPSVFEGFNGSFKLGSSLAGVASAFGRGALTTAVVNLETNDWHKDIYALDNTGSKQSKWNEYVGNALSGFLQTCAQLDDPLAPGKKVIDSLLVSLASEFTRTPRNANNTDNGDGGTQAFAFIGSKVRSGSFGDITPLGNTVGFDPSSGAMAGSPNVSESMVWKTAGKLMGFEDSTLAGFGVSGPSIPILVKT